MTAGEWLAYTVNVLAAATSILDARVACNGPGGTFHVEVDGVNVTGPMNIADTGGRQQWTDVSKAVALSAGPQPLRIVLDAVGASGTVGNLNYLRFTAAE